MGKAAPRAWSPPEKPTRDLPDRSRRYSVEAKTRPWRPRLILVPELRADLFVLAFRAAAALADDGVVRREAQRACGHDPGLQEIDRVLDRHFVQHVVALARELLDDPQLVGVEPAAASQPGLVGKPDGVEDERVAFPAAGR